jgi:hypothetical protein
MFRSILHPPQKPEIGFSLYFNLQVLDRTWEDNRFCEGWGSHGGED